MGPEYLSLVLTTIVAGISGGTWAANKILSRVVQRVKTIYDQVESQETKLDRLEEKLNRLPLEYVLKVDFLREIQNMHDNFKEINSKLDKMMDRLLK